MEEFVRRLIHEKRTRTERRLKPSETFARHFGEDHGVAIAGPGELAVQTAVFLRRGEGMTAPLAWLIETNVVSEMMRPRPEPRVAALFGFD